MSDNKVEIADVAAFDNEWANMLLEQRYEEFGSALIRQQSGFHEFFKNSVPENLSTVQVGMLKKFVEQQKQLVDILDSRKEKILGELQKLRSRNKLAKTYQNNNYPLISSSKK